MRSDTREAWVWNWLPGLSGPVLCGRFQWAAVPGGARTGRFVYARSYLDHAGALPLDPVLLPLRDAEFKTADLGGIFGVLRDAGPDTWGRLLIDRLHGSQDDLGYLVRAQGERTGSIDFSEARDVPPLAPQALTGMDQLVQASRAIRSVEAGAEIPEDLLKVLALGTPSGGARPKFSLRLDGRVWLAKFPASADPSHLPSVPIQECAALDLAARCGIQVPEHRLVDIDGVPVLLVARFDRVGATRLPYASARSVLWSNPEVQRYSFMGSYNNLARQLARWIREPGADRRSLYTRIAFNAATGNFDDHDLNHGVLFDPATKSYRLSPMFDPVAVSPRVGRDLAMGFGEDGQHISLENLLSRPGDFGLDRAHAQDIVQQVAGTVADHWQNHLRSLGAREVQIAALAQRFAFAREVRTDPAQNDRAPVDIDSEPDGELDSGMSMR